VRIVALFCSSVIVAHVAQLDHRSFRTIAIVLLIVSECANHARHSETMGFRLSSIRRRDLLECRSRCYCAQSLFFSKNKLCFINIITPLSIILSKSSFFLLSPLFPFPTPFRLVRQGSIMSQHRYLEEQPKKSSELMFRRQSRTGRTP
jgi:hypothetical protein